MFQPRFVSGEDRLVAVAVGLDTKLVDVGKHVCDQFLQLTFQFGTTFWRSPDDVECTASVPYAEFLRGENSPQPIQQAVGTRNPLDLRMTARRYEVFGLPRVWCALG